MLLTYIYIFLLVGLADSAGVKKSNYKEIYARQSSNQWFKDGVDLIRRNIQNRNINKKAKGVVLFLGDGMGITTVTAARIFDGQLRNETGEENVLKWEEFPNVALSKTYNTDQQVPDSAGTATAFITGVKTKSRVVGVNENVIKSNCTSQTGKELLSIVAMAEQNGLSTGVVTTARLTHATPASTYANVAYRGWEYDGDIRGKNQACKDIARQLIEFPYGDGIDVALGGGRKNFLKQYKGGRRKDGRDLTNEWKEKSSTMHKYVWNNMQFKKLDPDTDEKVLGLFSDSHMAYEYYRKDNEPSLTEMVDFAIKKLSRNEKGFFLLVEAGRIDHGHHKNNPILALHDTVELNKAVKNAAKLINSSEVLTVVTGDHSHVFTIGGYQRRGSDILGRTELKGLDKKWIETLAYANGPGGRLNLTYGRHEATLEELHNPEYMRETLVKLSSENHGGEDVGIYSQGPQAHLLRGVVEQNYIFHVMDYALCLSESKKEICQEEGLIGRTSKESIKSDSDETRRATMFTVSIIASTFLYILL